MLAALLQMGCVLKTIGRDMVAAEPPLETVTVDLKRYQGIWWAVESFPTWFERDCTCTQAVYSLRDNGRLLVLNQCVRNGKRSIAKGEAWPIQADDTGKLYVAFGSPFKGKYYVLYVDPDYRVALVGHPNRHYLWILARDPQVPEATLQQLRDIAAARGFDVSKLAPVPQACGPIE